MNWEFWWIFGLGVIGLDTAAHRWSGWTTAALCIAWTVLVLAIEVINEKTKEN